MKKEKEAEIKEEIIPEETAEEIPEEKIEEKEKSEPEPQTEENETAEKAEKSADVNIPDKNVVYLRGMIKAIRQELDDNNVEQNILTITTPQPKRDGSVGTERVDVIWGSNTRADGLISEYHAGDHVVVFAEYRTYLDSERHRGSNFYGITIKKAEAPGITGLTAHDPDKNEGYFVGTIRRINELRPNFAIVTLVLYSRNRRKRVTCYPAIGVGGYMYAAFKRNAEQFAIGKKMGVSCQINMRYNEQTNMKEIQWNTLGLFYYDEEGQQHKIDIPARRFVRAPRNNSNRERRPQVVSSTAEEDLRHMTNGAVTEEDDVTPSVPAEELESKPEDENAEVIEYENKDGKINAKILSSDEKKADIQRQLLQGMDEDDTE